MPAISARAKAGFYIEMWGPICLIYQVLNQKKPAYIFPSKKPSCFRISFSIFILTVTISIFLSAVSITRARFPCMLIYSCYRTRLNDHNVLYDNGNGVYSTNMNCTLAELVAPNIQYSQSTNFFKFFYINFTPLGC